MCAKTRLAWIRPSLLVAALALSACWKQPVTDVAAGFALADAVWFEEEETLFVFYDVEAEQGLRPESQVEISWTTDDEFQDWAPVSSLAPVHTHLPVNCGYTSICGSMSVHVPIRPRNIGVRLRYHRDGEMFLDTSVGYYEVGAGPPHRSRSLLVYGVFEEKNNNLQWRARHMFPNLRNMEVEALGLRRFFRVRDPGYGAEVTDLDPLGGGNPYSYGYEAVCDTANVALGWEPIETTDRAIFDPHSMPIAASAAPVVCGMSTVTDAIGTFDAVAIARKNPEVKAAFPALRSPIRENTAVGFFLEECDDPISQDHRDMQEQRLLLDDAPVICIDAWNQSGFANQLAARIQTAVDIERVEGNDMVVTLALHHDQPGPLLAGVIEDALDQVLVSESVMSSPHVSGGFVFDSYGYSIADPDLKHLTLWCPANIAGGDLDDIPAESERSCPILPDIPDLVLGPFKINVLPILTTREQYLTFIDKYSVAQAGRMKSLRFLAPERSVLSENVAAGEFGVVTFFDDETLSAAPEDAFSFCALEPVAALIVFRSDDVALPLPISELPNFHAEAPQPSYQLGLFWEFPFLLRLKYEATVAGAVTALDATVPFGVSATNRAYYGAEIWRTGDFPLDETLKQCTRFCDHPTFDSAGIYNVQQTFRESYANQCYTPRFPMPDDGGFPRDP